MNEVANYCKEVGADVDMVRRGVGTDNRIGPRFLFPGMGYGGSCFPKDIQALINFANKKGITMNVIEGAWKTNLKVRPEKDWEQLLGRAISEDEK